MKIIILALSLLLTASAASIPANDRVLHGHDFRCSGEEVEFETSVLVDFDGFDNDPKDVTRIDWKSLELLFKRTYNNLNEDFCDDQLRQILWVTAERNADGDKIIKRGGDTFSIRFTVQMKCKGCYPDEANLFAPPGSYSRALQEAIVNEAGEATGRALKKSKSSKKGYHYDSDSDGKSGKKGKGKGKGSSSGKGEYHFGAHGKGEYHFGDHHYEHDDYDERYCVCDSKHPQYRAPTEDEFRVAYDRAILSSMDGHLVGHRHGGVNVDYVTKVTETIDFSCSETVEEFSSLISVEFYGNSTDVTEAERETLEEAFLQVYNGLQDNRCDDPLFRNATLTDIVMQADPNEPQVFMYVFRVDGTCRGFGCSTELRFFDVTAEAFERRLHPLGDQGYNHSSPDSGCGCPVYGDEFGAPTVQDFEVRLFVVVQELKRREKLPNVDASGEVQELPLDATPAPTFANTTEPSASPSDLGDDTDSPTTSSQPSAIPSASPSVVPSAAGDTNSPSAVPSVGPSSQPSLSSAPSGTPSTVPSGVPSSSPSEPGDSTDAPSESSQPSSLPSLAPSTSGESSAPSQSSAPSGAPSTSSQPSVSTAPSLQPSSGPSSSSAPSTSEAPSSGPSASSAPSDSALPSSLPSSTPSSAPSEAEAPSSVPSLAPSSGPSSNPSQSAAPSDSAAPSSGPSESSAPSDSAAPSSLPSVAPSSLPSVVPSSGPSVVPSSGPSESPSEPQVTV